MNKDCTQYTLLLQLDALRPAHVLNDWNLEQLQFTCTARSLLINGNSDNHPSDPRMSGAMCLLNQIMSLL